MDLRNSLYVKDLFNVLKEICIAFLFYILFISLIPSALIWAVKNAGIIRIANEQSINLMEFFSCIFTIYALFFPLLACIKGMQKSRPKCYIRDIRKVEHYNDFFICLDIIPSEEETQIRSIHVKGCLISTNGTDFVQRLQLNHLYVIKRMDEKNCIHVRFYVRVPDKLNNKVLTCSIYGNIMTFNVFFPLSCKIVPPNLSKIDKKFISF